MSQRNSLRERYDIETSIVVGLNPSTQDNDQNNEAKY